MEEELSSTRARLALVESQAANKDAAVELAATEAQRAREERREMEERLKKVEAENKDLVDRWMEQKLKDAERLNEVSVLFESLISFCQFLVSFHSILGLTEDADVRLIRVAAIDLAGC